MTLTRARTLVGAAVLLALLGVGCTRHVTGAAIGRQDITGAGIACTAVSAPMTPIPTKSDDEPRMLIPQPWAGGGRPCPTSSSSGSRW